MNARRASRRSAAGTTAPNQSRPSELVLLEAEQLAALAVDELDAARVVEDDHERAGDVQVALRAVALLAQAALGGDRLAHRRSSPCAHATAIDRRAAVFIRKDPS